MSTPKPTPLRDFHLAHGGRLVEFAGWEMPVQYRSILEEHKAVRRTAGLFDVSHMGEFDVKGAGAADFLNRLLTNDVGRLVPGRALYSPMCYPHGGVVDDLIVYMRGEGDYFVCVNAGNIDKDFAWIEEAAAGRDVTVVDRSPETALLAVQGPRAIEIVQTLTETDLPSLASYGFISGRVAKVDCLISRTGYTGEDGVELYHEASAAPHLADAILAAGESRGLQLAGLGARDSLRLEAGYPLYGHEISAEISPLTAGLGWTVKLKKEADFNGRAALAEEKKRGGSHRVVFFRTGDRRIVRTGADVSEAAGAPVGRVLSGTLSPMLNEAIGSALVPLGAREPFQVDVRGTMFNLHLVKPPFVELGKNS